MTADMQIRQAGNSRKGRGRSTRLVPRAEVQAWVASSSRADLLRLEPNELFKACETHEKRFESISGKEFLQILDRLHLFGEPVFSDEPASRARRGYPLNLVITRPKRAKGSKAEWHYTELLRHLKKISEPDLRWLLIARWLEAEGICHAEEFLPREILGRLLSRVSRKRMRVSPSDLWQGRLMGIWLPYFTKLLSDRDKLPKTHRGPIDALLRMGYDRRAVEAADDRRSELQATVRWLASRKGLTERTLENAYSRLKRASQKADSTFFKSLERSPREITPSEYPNFLHSIL
jgi:lambda repressor-like predicted transcriptional regulator